MSVYFIEQKKQLCDYNQQKTSSKVTPTGYQQKEVKKEELKKYGHTHPKAYLFANY